MAFASGARDRKNVLIIDTHPTSRLILEEEIGRTGISAACASSAKEGLNLALSFPPDMIVLDLALNGTSGLQVINELRVSEKTRAIPVVVVSSLHDKRSAAQARKAGVVELLDKPFSPGALARIVNDHFKQATLQVAPSNILLVEDSETIRAITRYLLEKQGHTVTEAADGELGLDALLKEPTRFDMVITDINMPNMDGIELTQRIRSDNRFQFVPIMISTTISDKENIKKLLNLGADDYIVKPFSTEEFIARIGSHLRITSLYKDLKKANQELATFNETLESRVIERTEELRDANLDAIYSLAVAAEAKDDGTGNHVFRIQKYCYALSKQLGLSEAVSDEIGYSSIMHDVGKISVPDHILKKPGKLTTEEFTIMKMHSAHGERILPAKPFFLTARIIARSHHEKWNGAGYPDGLRGKEIPLPARIVAVADVFDALTNKRCYKEAWSIEDALAEIENSSGSHFDPDMVKAWVELTRSGRIVEIVREMS